MARITLNEIAQELSNDGWTVISTDYQNLDTEMEFMCNEGHKVFTTWKKLRTKRECPVCKQNQLKSHKNIICEKVKGENRILGLDQASHISGFSIFDGKKLVQYGVYNVSGNTEAERIHDVKIWLMSLIENWKPDLIGIEGIQYQQDVGVTTFQSLARLQGVLIDLCVELKIPYQVCATNTWRAHCGVKGKSRNDKKRSMQLLVKEWFDISVTDDEADAIGLGKFVAETHQKQMEVVDWE